MRARALSLLTAIALSTTTATSARAAEAEPHYGWWAPPREGSRGLDAAINERLERGLLEVNRRGDRGERRCEDVALAISTWLEPTAGWFFVGLTRSWNVDFSPRSSTEYVESFLPLSVYRQAWLLPFGRFVPTDPAVRVGDVVFGTDKIAHFFTNGARYYRRYLDERRRGVDEAAAEEAAIGVGLAEEAGILGQWASGIFSYADLQANYRGLQFHRSLCEGDAGLILDDGGWRLVRPFQIADHVDPCWDEAFEPCAFSPRDHAPIREATARLCPRWRAPAARDRWTRYEALGCPGRSHALVTRLRREGQLPDPTPTSIATICGATVPTPTPSTSTSPQP